MIYAKTATTDKATVTESAGLQVQERPLQYLHSHAERGNLYAILDSSDAPLVPARMQQLGPEKAVSLFQGASQERYSGVAPYLVNVDGSLLEWLYKNFWEEPWGIFVVAEENLQDLSEHFRQFLIVKLPDQKHWYFRYYDPNVLQIFLPTCNALELLQFFGPVQEYGAGKRSSQTFISMSLRNISGSGS